MRHASLVFVMLLAACSNERGDAPAADTAAALEAATEEAATETAAPSLERVWLAEGFGAPEGVALAPDGAYFISNVAGEGEAKDGAGWISKLSVDGEIIAARFIDGLDGPKGMAVHDGLLYVADIDQVRTFDAASAAPGAAITIPDAKFLNDAAVWRDEVYVSDSGTGRIWRLAADGPHVWREGEELDGVNGLLGDGKRMLVSTMTSGGLYEATPNGGWREIASGMIDADGIGVVPQSAGGGYLVSSWPGEIHYVGAEGSVTQILNTREAGILQNDLTIFGNIVIVPNWEPGTVTAWKFSAN
jgi:sugar lactone lactonase YvrE